MKENYPNIAGGNPYQMYRISHIQFFMNIENI